ncbi:hypothetical protein ACJD0Z_06895 [Flavobacteriaceae bacterium M23B6Z8]
MKEKSRYSRIIRTNAIKILGITVNGPYAMNNIADALVSTLINTLILIDDSAIVLG